MNLIEEDVLKHKGCKSCHVCEGNKKTYCLTHTF